VIEDEVLDPNLIVFKFGLLPNAFDSMVLIVGGNIGTHPLAIPF
jgi:hypothetical protein